MRLVEHMELLGQSEVLGGMDRCSGGGTNEEEYETNKNGMVARQKPGSINFKSKGRKNSNTANNFSTLLLL